MSPLSFTLLSIDEFEALPASPPSLQGSSHLLMLHSALHAVSR